MLDWLFDLRGGSGALLVEMPANKRDVQEPSFTPDGQFVYYTQPIIEPNIYINANHPNYVIKRRELASGATEQLMGGWGSATSPRVSRDGRKVAFIRRVKEKTVLFVYDAAARTQTPVLASVAGGRSLWLLLAEATVATVDQVNGGAGNDVQRVRDIAVIADAILGQDTACRAPPYQFGAGPGFDGTQMATDHCVVATQVLSRLTHAPQTGNGVKGSQGLERRQGTPRHAAGSGGGSTHTGTWSHGSPHPSGAFETSLKYRRAWLAAAYPSFAWCPFNS